MIGAVQGSAAAINLAVPLSALTMAPGLRYIAFETKFLLTNGVFPKSLKRLQLR